ncbi:hypothetical protein EVA_13152 [gut metagenome]|uniref:Uncharacterized protein n=1 Tax=gut metagenome TaxID=749906 RepID=J9FW38_9ZZZZ
MPLQVFSDAILTGYHCAAHHTFTFIKDRTLSRRNGLNWLESTHQQTTVFQACHLTSDRRTVVTNTHTERSRSEKGFGMNQTVIFSKEGYGLKVFFFS